MPAEQVLAAVDRWRYDITQVQPGEPADGWALPASALSPAALAFGAKDPRWRRRFIAAFDGGRLAGMLPLDVPLSDSVADPAYDLASLVPGWTGMAPRPCYIGGRESLMSAAVVAARLRGDEASSLTAGLVAAAVQIARREGRQAVAPYVHSGQLAGFAAGFGESARREVIGQAARLAVVGRSLEDYIAGRRRDHRHTMAADRRRFATSGLVALTRPAAEVVDEMTPLVANVKRKHGIPEHERFIQLRLRRWISGPGLYRACEVRDGAGLLIAATLCCHLSGRLEVYEIGLRGDDSPRRLAAYLETVIYEPLRYAYARGVREVALGMAATMAKSKRGAMLTPVSALLASTPALNGELGSNARSRIHSQGSQSCMVR